MGQQVNFFWCGQDEEKFLAMAREQSGDLCVLGHTSRSEAFEPLPELPCIGERFAFHVWLWDRSACKPPIVRLVQNQGYYTIDPSVSEVVELSRSYERNGSLVRGRLWAELTAWNAADPDHLLEKSVAFRKWFRSLVDWTRRHYTRTPEGWYLAPGAEAFQRRGGALVQADFDSVVRLQRHQ